jgi:hypothetical protein
MAYAYGNQYGFGSGEHESTRTQKAAWGQQRSMAQQQDRDSWERGREMYERGLQQQEQQRRQYDSQTARGVGEKKYDVLAGLAKGMNQGGMGQFWPYGGSNTFMSRRIGGQGMQS